MRKIIALMTIGIGIGYLLPIENSMNSTYTVQDMSQEQDNTNSITHAEIVNLTDGFMEKLVQEADNLDKVKKYNNKDSLLKEFRNIATVEVVQPYLDYYYKEENNELYIIPTETPPWFDEQNEYDVVQLSQDKILVKQKNQSELYGEYGIDIEMTFANQEWKITKITHR
ncbi:hypothetical protein [Paucisalibacillus globulus]|uniref:hypothetical protein n=1 Tax=Paucisalibacillus globulus TaxID=351095 RepID=UPI000BB8FA08|nr:hypothetical protein [Paucisalibacillus globulus]